MHAGFARTVARVARQAPRGDAIGIRKLPSGNWQVFLKVRGRFYGQVFPATASRAEMRTWRRRQREAVLASLPPPAPPPPRIVPLTDHQKAEVLDLLRQAIREQATGGRPILEGMRQRLCSPEVTE